MQRGDGIGLGIGRWGQINENRLEKKRVEQQIGCNWMQCDRAIERMLRLALYILCTLAASVAPSPLLAMIVSSCGHH